MKKNTKRPKKKEGDSDNTTRLMWRAEKMIQRVNAAATGEYRGSYYADQATPGTPVGATGGKGPLATQKKKANRPFKVANVHVPVVSNRPFKVADVPVVDVPVVDDPVVDDPVVPVVDVPVVDVPTHEQLIQALEKVCKILKSLQAQ